jgi:hypothetical protein
MPWEDVSVSNNFINNCADEGIRVATGGGIGTRVRQNAVTACAFGVNVSGSHEGLAITDNDIRDSQKQGINFAQAGFYTYLIVARNQVRNSNLSNTGNTDGIAVKGALLSSPYICDNVISTDTELYANLPRYGISLTVAGDRGTFERNRCRLEHASSAPFFVDSAVVTNTLRRFAHPTLEVIGAAGTDVTPVAGTIYSVLWTSHATGTLSGLYVLLGSVTASGGLFIAAHTVDGKQFATRAASLNLSGAPINSWFQVPFSTPRTIQDGDYILALSFNSAANRFRAIPAGAPPRPTSAVAGAGNIPVTITPPTTFVADVGPIVLPY